MMVYLYVIRPRRHRDIDIYDNHDDNDDEMSMLFTFVYYYIFFLLENLEANFEELNNH